MNKLVCLAVLVLAVAHACLGASEFKFPDTVMSTIDVGCNPLVDFFDCMPFLETFKWPLTVRTHRPLTPRSPSFLLPVSELQISRTPSAQSLRVEGPVTILQKPEVALKDASTSYVIFNVNNSANWSGTRPFLGQLTLPHEPQHCRWCLTRHPPSLLLPTSCY
jgi:hypothetical protein